MKKPTIAKDAFIAHDADIYGDVQIGEGCSVWFNAVLRTEDQQIIVGKGTNIQDCTVIHTGPGLPVVIGEGVTIGHRAMIHGCTIGDNTLIGMGATVLNGAKVGKNCIIGACALITEGKEIPDGCMAFGSPAKVVRPLTEEEIARNAWVAGAYTDEIALYREEGADKNN